jgi:hypothetical protein
VCCADLNSFETSLPAPAPLEISGSVLPVHQQSPCTAAVTSAAAALFDQLSAPVADVAPAPPVTVQSQVLEAVTAACTSPAAPALPVAASPEHLDTAMKEAASVLFGNLSSLRQIVNTAESDLKEDIALRRQSGLPLEEDMVISATSQSGETKSVAAKLPYMRHKLRAKLDFWKSLNAPKSVLNWIEFGYMGTFLTD